MAQRNKSRMLVGVLVAAGCAAPQVRPAYPLCDREGAPACGNVGQVGRPAAPARAVAAAPAPMVEVQASEQARAPVRPTTRPLLAPAPARQQMSPGRPLADEDRRPACGNVMTKGPSRC